MRTPVLRSLTLSVLAALPVLFAGLRADAAPINYGNYSGTNVNFENVTEDSATDPTPLYGAPTVSGDALVFSPTAEFSARSTLGAPAVDITDGKLNVTFTSKGSTPLGQLVISEQGDRTLIGALPTSNAGQSIGAAVFVTVLVSEVNGVSVAPYTVSGNLVFTPKSSWSLASGDAATAATFTGTLTLDLGNATKATLAADNTLVAFSDASSISFIAKKQFEIGFIPPVGNPVPEPASLAVVGLGVLPLLLKRRRRSL
jgi:hypothetical protein